MHAQLTADQLREYATPELQAAFLDVIPTIQRVADHFFRGVRCADRREDMTAEAIGLGWKALLSLARRGRTVEGFTTTWAARLCQAVRNGRRLGCAQESLEPLAPIFQAKHAVSVQRIPQDDGGMFGLGNEALQDRRGSDPAVRAAIRLSLPAILESLGATAAFVCQLLAEGATTNEASAQAGCSPGRVSQIRREFLAAWNAD